MHNGNMEPAEAAGISSGRHRAPLSRNLMAFSFWEWFHSMLKLVSSDYMRPYWPALIGGFVSQEYAESALTTQKNGTVSIFFFFAPRILQIFVFFSFLYASAKANRAHL